MKVDTNFRNAEQINSLKEFYLSEKVNFKLRHSTYSTSFEFGNEKISFGTNSYNKKVFVVYQKIMNDIKNSDFVKQILEEEYSTNNYDLRWGLKPQRYGKVINIDVKAAYPTTLINYGIISRDTFKRMMSLPKEERLVAFGMCAKRSTVFIYNEGELIDWDVETGPFAKVFYFVVQKVNEVMLKCKEIAGEYYLFHWVDGIFLEKSCPDKIVNQIKSFLKSEKYFYSFEKIDNLIIEREETMVSCTLEKNDMVKEYKFADRNMIDTYNEILNVLENDTIHLPRNATSSLELSSGNPTDDLPL